ncbi:MAG: TetR/AcrR family transcriptional regulator [Paenibacillus sp.]|nr:TetR/AcrR family transcriptional regulator [Paenibacillus sp.]
MNGFEIRANAIKAKIRATTLDLLRTTELKKIRIADIAKQASVSQVTIYNYFGSKTALYRETFIEFAEKAIADFEAYLNEGHTLKEKIEHIILLEKTTYRDFPPARLRELLSQDPQLAAYFERQIRERSIPMTERIIREGKMSGEISDDVMTENVLAFMMLFSNQYDLILEMAQQSGDMDRFLEGMVQLFFYGICGKPQSEVGK